ncbi:MAG: glutamine amidotransferase class-I [Bacteroidetes bacterium]|nr:glutamine amidotransferase class-I [Bacteroidota bacterium]
MKQLTIHLLMHVPYEGPGCIETWVQTQGHNLSYTKLYENQNLPALSNFDWLIVMGGPMSVYEEEQYNWLATEKAFIKDAIGVGKTVLGICLGSQLIADVLGASVYPNHQKEIGWFDIHKTDSGKVNSLLKDIDNDFKVFHWHGDTYDLPSGSTHLFYSNVCRHQAFLYGQRVVGLQFHFEVTAETLQGMVANGVEELTPGATVQSAETILAEKNYFQSNNANMYNILDALALLSVD